jgi:hypothetical protein
MPVMKRTPSAEVIRTNSMASLSQYEQDTEIVAVKM